MARLPSDPNLPAIGSINYEDQLRWQIDRVLRQIFQQINALTEGNITAIDNASTAPPTTGSHAQGDFIRNKTPSEAGSASSKYVIMGWLCTVSGEPGTWVECRFLTGN